MASPEPTQKDITNRARAIENQAYVVSANTAGIFTTGIPSTSADAMSKVVDYKGHVLACADAGESLVASADIDITALRAARHQVGMPAYLSRQRLEAFASIYSNLRFTRLIHCCAMVRILCRNGHIFWTSTGKPLNVWNLRA